MKVNGWSNDFIIDNSNLKTQNSKLQLKTENDENQKQIVIVYWPPFAKAMDWHGAVSRQARDKYLEWGRIVGTCFNGWGIGNSFNTNEEFNVGGEEGLTVI